MEREKAAERNAGSGDVRTTVALMLDAFPCNVGSIPMQCK